MRVTVSGTEYIVTDELEAIFDALEILNISDVESFTGNDQLDLHELAQDGNIDTVLESSMIQAIISRQVIDLDDVSTAIQVPFRQENNTINVRITVDDGLGHQTDYISVDELVALVLSLDALNMTDVNEFDGAIDLTLLSDPLVKATILTSSIIKATISEQLINLDDSDQPNPTFIIPYFEEDTSTEVLIETGPFGFETIYISSQEISDLLDALDVLNITSVTGFDSSSVDFSTFAEGTNSVTMTESAIIQAIISKQLLDLDADVLVPVLVPYRSEADGVVRVTVGPAGHLVELIVKEELQAAIVAMDMLDVTDPTGFTGDIDLSLFYDSTSRDTLLASSIMQITISKQIIDIGSAIIVPTYTDTGTVVRLTVGDPGEQNEYIKKFEIHALFESLEMLEMDNFDDFDGTISLTKFLSPFANYDTNQSVLLNSASIQATISKQILDMQTTVNLIVPTHDVDSGVVNDDTYGTDYIFVPEIKHLLNAMKVLGFSGNLDEFTGTINISLLYSEPNQDTLLSSAIMHATITDKVNGLNGTALVVPTTDVSDDDIQTTIFTFDFIIKDEIKDLLNALEVIGVGGDITAFGGQIDMTNLYGSDSNQTILLTSAIMHATISDQINGLTVGGNLTVPSSNYTDDVVEFPVSSNYFIMRLEIKALLNALEVIGVTGNLNGFDGSIDLTALADSTNQTTLLASGIMHATLSNKLLTGTGGNLIIPDVDVNDITLVRVPKGGVIFIEYDETKALLTALDEMGLTSIGGITITTTALFNADFDVLLASSSMQATISSNILSGALDDTAAAGSGKLVIPNFFREAITVETVAEEWIETVELKALLNSLKTLGIDDFSGSVDGSVVSGMTDAQLDKLLASGSMQVSIDNMLKGNANINTMIPDLALEDVYGMTDITTTTEIKAFINDLNALVEKLRATQQLPSGDITNVTFSAAIIVNMTSGEKDIALDSMIVRNILTDELEAIMLADDPLDPYLPDPTDYESENPALFLTEAGINLVLAHYDGLI